jgi:hypothetical protein
MTGTSATMLDHWLTVNDGALSGYFCIARAFTHSRREMHPSSVIHLKGISRGTMEMFPALKYWSFIY